MKTQIIMLMAVFVIVVSSGCISQTVKLPSLFGSVTPVQTTNNGFETGTYEGWLTTVIATSSNPQNKITSWPEFYITKEASEGNYASMFSLVGLGRNEGWKAMYLRKSITFNHLDYTLSYDRHVSVIGDPCVFSVYIGRANIYGANQFRTDWLGTLEKVTSASEQENRYVTKTFNLKDIHFSEDIVGQQRTELIFKLEHGQGASSCYALIDNIQFTDNSLIVEEPVVVPPLPVLQPLPVTPTMPSFDNIFASIDEALRSFFDAIIGRFT